MPAPTDQMLIESLVGLIGGGAGGVLPDVLEPASDPNHRKVAHCLVVGGALGAAKIAEWQVRCRTSADTAAARALTHPEGGAERSRSQWDTFVLRLFAGILIGFATGYASHLALDACTPRGLPILGV